MSPHMQRFTAPSEPPSQVHMWSRLSGKRTVGGCGTKPPQARGKRWLPPPPPDGEVFRTDQQPTYHAHGVLWGIEFLLAPAPKPSSEGAPKRQRLTILGAWLQAKGEVQGQVEAPEAPPPA